MLNLLIAMLTKNWVGLGLVLSFFLMGVQTQPPDQPRLSSPQSGSAVQGSVNIIGNTTQPGFQYAEISFSYAGAQAGNWFLIQQIQQPVNNALLAVWDTTTIADGSYQLRLQVFLSGGKVEEVVASGLRVRNYTAIETTTPTIVQASTRPAVTRPAETATPTTTLIPLTATPRFTPTAFSSNPAQVQSSRLLESLGMGLGAVILIFILIALYQGAHKQS